MDFKWSLGGVSPLFLPFSIDVQWSCDDFGLGEPGRDHLGRRQHLLALQAHVSNPSEARAAASTAALQDESTSFRPRNAPKRAEIASKRPFSRRALPLLHFHQVPELVDGSLRLQQVELVAHALHAVHARLTPSL